jgi:hypothetical protein
MFISFSYNRVTSIKHTRRLFKTAEPAMIVTLFMVVFSALHTQVPALLRSRSPWGVKRGGGCSRGSARGCEGRGDDTGDNSAGGGKGSPGGVESCSGVESIGGHRHRS